MIRTADKPAPIAVSPRRDAGQATWRSVLDVVATAAMLFVAAFTVWNWYHPVAAPSSMPPPAGAPPLPTQPVSVDGLPLIGAPEAKVAVLIFSDFQCPYCAQFASETMPALRTEYVQTGLVRVGFRHLPLSFHSRAKRAAESAECAAEQGHFWAMHDALFRRPSNLEEGDLTSTAAAIHLDTTRFVSCMSHPPSDRIQRDLDIARGLGLSGTPSFIVGRLDHSGLHATSLFVGMRQIDFFEKALNLALSGH